MILVLFYKVSMNTGLANPMEKYGLVPCEPMITEFSSTDQCITLFYMYFLFKDTLFNIYY